MMKIVNLIRKGIKIVDKVKNFIETLWWVIPVIAAIAAAVVGAIKKFNGDDNTGSFEENVKESVSKEPAKIEKQKPDGQTSRYTGMWTVQMEADSIDSEMAKLTGGSTGMLACKIRFHETTDACMAEQFRDAFNIKQRQLRRLYKQLEALKQENPSVHTSGDDKMYRELMVEQL